MPRTAALPTPKGWASATASPLLVRPFLDHLERQASGQLAQRKLRLIACAAARCLFRRLPDDTCRAAVEVGERFADGLATAKERDAAFKAVYASHAQFERQAGIEDELDVHLMPNKLRARVFRSLAEYGLTMQAVKPVMAFADLDRVCHTLPGLLLPAALYEQGYSTEHGYQFEYDAVDDPLPDRIRDVLGYPFAPVPSPKKWQTEAVMALADGIAANGKYDRLPILADALEEAGCADRDVLTHCRTPGPHVRGCWVVDLVRGVHWQPKV